MANERDNPQSTAEQDVEREGEERRRPLTFDQELRKEFKPRKKGGFALRIGMLAALTVVVALIVMLVQQWKPPQVEVPDTTVPLMVHDRESVLGVTVSVKGDEPYTVEYIADENNIRKYVVSDWPSDIKLLQSPLGDAYTSVVALNAQGVVEENPQDLSIYGLDDPTSTLTVHLADGSEQSLYLGAKLASNVGWYAMKQGDSAVYSITDYAGERMKRTTKDLRDLSIVPQISVDAADYILIERGEQDAIELKKESSAVSINMWKILRPQELEASIEPVQTLAQSIAGLSFSAYVDTADDLAQYGLAQPRARVQITDEQGNALGFAVGDSADESASSYYVALEGSNEVYTASASSLSYIEETTLTSVVDRFAAIINIANVDLIDFVSPSGSRYALKIEREEQFDEEGERKMLANGQPDYIHRYYVNDKQVEENPFKKIYQQLISVQVQGEIKGEAQGEAVSSITYAFNNGAEPLTTKYIPYQQDFYAIEQSGVRLFYTRVETLNKVEPMLLTAMRLPIGADVADVLSIEIDFGDGDVRTFSREGGEATFKGISIESERMDDAYRRLATASLQEHIANVSTDGDPALRITYRYADGREPIQVQYFESQQDMYNIAVPGQPGQFTMSQRTLLGEIENFDTWIQ